MKKLLSSLFLFVAIFLIVIVLILLCSPVTPMRKNNMLNAIMQKDSMMENTPSPRLIIIGGSNVTFGFNSQIIKDSLHLNSINAGLHAGIGIIYSMNQAKPHLRKGDILIISPEYNQFYGNVGYGSQELLHVLFDVSLSNLRYLDLSNYKAFVGYLYYYIRSKTYIHEYTTYTKPIYSDKAFNQYGDACLHWDTERRIFTPMQSTGGVLNLDVLQKMKAFINDVEQKGVVVYVAYPGIQDISFDFMKSDIKQMQQLYEEYGFKTLGTPEKFSMPDSLMFDTPFHLSKGGADLRTKLLIEDLKAVGVK